MSRKATIAVAVTSAVLAVAALVVGVLWHFGAFVTDRSVVVGLESLEWQGRSYSPVYGKYDAGRRIAKTTNGLDVYEIKGDPEHNFLLVPRLSTATFTFAMTTKYLTMARSLGSIGITRI